MAPCSRSGTWTDAGGRTVTRPESLPSTRAATAIAAADELGDLVLIHDSALCDDRELLDRVSGLLLVDWRQG